MKLEHIAIWTNHLERLKDFYITYFDVVPNEMYENKTKAFKSYFLSFDGGARIEIMSKTGVVKHENLTALYFGYSHIAVDVGSRSEVISLTSRLRNDGYIIESEPRMTGDGYFESVVLDPDGNRIELTCSSSEWT